MTKYELYIINILYAELNDIKSGGSLKWCHFFFPDNKFSCETWFKEVLDLVSWRNKLR